MWSVQVDIPCASLAPYSLTNTPSVGAVFGPHTGAWLQLASKQCRSHAGRDEVFGQQAGVTRNEDYTITRVPSTRFLLLWHFNHHNMKAVALLSSSHSILHCSLHRKFRSGLRYWLLLILWTTNDNNVQIIRAHAMECETEELAGALNSTLFVIISIKWIRIYMLIK